MWGFGSSRWSGECWDVGFTHHTTDDDWLKWLKWLKWSSTLNSKCRMAESQTLGLLMADVLGEVRPPRPSERPHGEIAPEGHAAAQEEALLPRASSSSMDGYEAAPMGHPGETPSLGVTVHSTLGSVRPYWHEPQRVPVRGSGIAVAETESVLQNRLCSVYVPASPSERAELCLPRGGAPALAGDRHDDDDDDARTTHSPNTDVPGVSGTSVLAKLQIPSDWGTQETPAK